MSIPDSTQPDSTLRDSTHADSTQPDSTLRDSTLRYGAALWLSAAAFVVSLVATTVLIARVPALPVNAIPLLYAAATATVPILIVCAILTLLRPVMRATVTTRIVVGVTSGLGFVLLGIALASWSIGFDAADAGTEQGTFAELFLVWAGGAIVLEWVAATLIGYLLGRQPIKRGARWLVSAIAGLVIAMFAIIGAVNPVSQLVVACAMLLLPVLLRRSASSTQKEQREHTEHSERSAWREENVAPSPHRWERARRQARVLAGGSLMCTLAIWGGALIASIGFRGTEAATTVLTGAGGASQLAAIPLIGAGTVILVARYPHAHRLLWGAAIVASALIAVMGCSVALAGTPDGTLLFALLPLLGLAAGLWTGAAAWVMLARPGHVGPVSTRIIGAVAIGLSGAVGYVIFVISTMGISLAVVSTLLLVWGARAALVSPAISRA
jgi:hypothetical protein